MPDPRRLRRVRALQDQLIWLGFDPGPVDGRYGPWTTNAVKRFQLANDLEADGVVGAVTAEALRARSPDPPTRGRIERVKELQRQLTWLGLEPGLIDGRYGPLTTGAVKRFQKAHDLVVDGVVGPATAEALRASAPNARPPIGPNESGRYSSSSARSGSSPGRSTAAMARRRRTRSSGSSRPTTSSPTGSSIRSRSTRYGEASSSSRIEARSDLRHEREQAACAT